MSGAASQCDTFDYKPVLIKQHGEKFDPGGKVELFQSVPGAVMKSPWEWKQHGQCGKWISDLVPHLAGCVDDIAFLHSMVVEVERPRPGDVHAEHRLRPAGLPEHGGVGLLRPGQPEREPADVRRPARLARLRPERPGELERRVPARRAPGDDDPRRQRRIRSPTCSRPKDAVHHRRRARRDGLELLDAS